jgi:hypothetical protein
LLFITFSFAIALARSSSKHDAAPEELVQLMQFRSIYCANDVRSLQR